MRYLLKIITIRVLISLATSFRVERLQNAMLLCLFLKFSVSLSVAWFPEIVQYFEKKVLLKTKSSYYFVWASYIDYLPHSWCRTSSTSFLFHLFFMAFELTFCRSFQFARCSLAFFITFHFLLCSFRLVFISNILHEMAFHLLRHGASMCFPLDVSCKHHEVLCSA